MISRTCQQIKRKFLPGKVVPCPAQRVFAERGATALLFLTLVYMLAMPLRPALTQEQAAEFRLYPTCETPENKIEAAICSSEAARRVHREVARAYVRLYQLMTPKERLQLEVEHFEWLDGMYKACSGSLFDEQGAAALLDQLAASMRADCVIFRGEARKDDMQKAYGDQSFLEELSQRRIRQQGEMSQDAANTPSPATETTATETIAEDSTLTPSEESEVFTLNPMRGDLTEEEETRALLAEAERLVRLIEEEQAREAIAADGCVLARPFHSGKAARHALDQGHLPYDQGNVSDPDSLEGTARSFAALAIMRLYNARDLIGVRAAFR